MLSRRLLCVCLTLSFLVVLLPTASADYERDWNLEIGKAGFVTKDMVKEGAVVIDVGINRREDGSLCGDVDYAAVEPIASAITPVPGGVGPMTIAMLLSNTLDACTKRQK